LNSKKGPNRPNWSHDRFPGRTVDPENEGTPLFGSEDLVPKTGNIDPEKSLLVPKIFFTFALLTPQVYSFFLRFFHQDAETFS
jgi:hypothetical protein